MSPGGRRSRLAPVAVSILVVIAAAMALLCAAAPRADEEFRIGPAQGEALGALMNPGVEGFPPGIRLQKGDIGQSSATFHYADGLGQSWSVELHQRDALRSPEVRTGQFALRVSPAAPAPFLAALEGRLREREGTFLWVEAAEHPTPGWLRRAVNLQQPAAVFLLIQAPLWLLLAGWRALRRSAEMPRWARLGLAAALAAGVIARAAAPLKLVTLYIGYQLTAQAIALDTLPRYGAGVVTLHHALLALFGPDHLVILRAHSVLGALLVPVFGVLAATWHRRPGAGVAAAAIMALGPAFVAHSNSESNSVAPLLFFGAGLLLWLDYLDERRTSSLAGAAALLATAAIGRPEFPVLVAVAVPLLWAGRLPRPGTALPPAPFALPIALASAVLVAPHLLGVMESAALLSSSGGLALALRLPHLRDVAVLDPGLHPILLVPFALLGAVARPRTSAPLLAIAALATGLTFVDLDRANILRVQIPGAAFYVLAAAAGVDALPGLLEARLPRAALALSLAALLGLAASAVPGVGSAFARTNEDEEEDFIRAARAKLPGGDFVLVRLGYGDLERRDGHSPVHLYFPDYLFTPPGGRAAVRDVFDWERDPGALPAYFFLGERCYTPEHLPAGRPSTVPLRPACARMLARASGPPLVERDAPNHGDPTGIGFYGADTGRPVRLALLPLGPLRDSPGAAPASLR